MDRRQLEWIGGGNIQLTRANSNRVAGTITKSRLFVQFASAVKNCIAFGKNEETTPLHTAVDVTGRIPPSGNP